MSFSLAPSFSVVTFSPVPSPPLFRSHRARRSFPPLPCRQRIHSGPVLAALQDFRLPLRLRLDARHASPLPLRPTHVLRLEAASSRLAGQRCHYGLRAPLE